ncbi:hypothetical protein KO465_01040 [Candidatus Micrarchaeota archaeon]|nr:hypothetical protein [Candidatus Micrarchaeota archaeon]
MNDKWFGYTFIGLVIVAVVLILMVGMNPVGNRDSGNISVDEDILFVENPPISNESEKNNIENDSDYIETEISDNFNITLIYLYDESCEYCDLGKSDLEKTNLTKVFPGIKIKYINLDENEALKIYYVEQNLLLTTPAYVLEMPNMTTSMNGYSTFEDIEFNICIYLNENERPDSCYENKHIKKLLS